MPTKLVTMKNPTTLRTITLCNLDSATATLLLWAAEPEADEGALSAWASRGEVASSSSSEDSTISFLRRMLGISDRYGRSLTVLRSVALQLVAVLSPVVTAAMDRGTHRCKHYPHTISKFLYTEPSGVELSYVLQSSTATHHD